ncbi:Hypothetical predicted protein [Prunus dulcis]|uniref:Uncharacterized protein n=1 Tax=Prunus dulcis TaxID=3755 RepID=A0A5E4EYJ8_PRUDU|nr:hypothetical protein L3X38_031175 [Prunus dulcis]VVA20763.1 Hypothetical predicted protein [Prunus dulcis]
MAMPFVDCFPCYQGGPTPEEDHSTELLYTVERVSTRGQFILLLRRCLIQASNPHWPLAVEQTTDNRMCLAARLTKTRCSATCAPSTLGSIEPRLFYTCRSSMALT